MGEVEIKVKPGRGVAVINLKEEIWTVDKRRVIDLHDIRAIAFCGSGKEQIVYIDNIRIERKSEETTDRITFLSPSIICKEVNKGYHDPYAPLCPFCCKENKDFKKVDELKESKNSIKIYPDNDCTVMARDGGGGDTVTAVDSSLHIAHYDDSFWEGRGILSFKIPDNSYSKVNKAELRIYVPQNPGKPFFPVIEVFSISDKYKIEEKSINWISQPPVEEFLLQSGVYHGTDAPRWLVFDITDYINNKLKENRKRFIFELRAGISACTYSNPHPLGHYLVFASKEYRDKNYYPVLYLEK
jgi:hypothetical protein